MRNFLILTSGRHGVFARLLESTVGLPSYFYSYTEPQLVTFPRLLVLPLRFLDRTLCTSYVMGGDLRWAAIWTMVRELGSYPALYLVSETQTTFGFFARF